MPDRATETEAARIRAQLAELDRQRTDLANTLVRIERATPASTPPPSESGLVTAESSAAAKVALFRRLFAGRHDVFPLRWENTKTGRSGYAPACANEWIRGICNKPQVKCGECSNQAFIPIADDVIGNHLRGFDRSKSSRTMFVAGVYPLLHDETCWFLAADFDGAHWSADALAYLDTCRQKGVTAALERSRSGDGGHVWIFFAESIPAREAELSGRVFGVRMPVEDEDADQPWLMSPSRRPRVRAVAEPHPSEVDLTLADEVYIDRTNLPPGIVAQLIRVAAFQNPEFYRAQAMRLSTFGKPRIVSCAMLHPRHVAVPRGCLDEAVELLRSRGIESRIDDRRETGTPLSVQFLGTLREEQVAAFNAIAAHDFGVLAATTAFGKTVVAAALTAHRACSTLILVHRRELLTQWVERLTTFLSVEPGDIGTIGGGRKKPTGRIDVAVIQSLVRKGEVSDLLAGYGQLIVDECHHLSAASFELVARRSKARYVLGLSATVARRDGHHPIIFMQCGPVRYRTDPKSQAVRRGFVHRVVFCETSFQVPAGDDIEKLSMPAIAARVAHDDARNARIVEDVRAALTAGRTPLVLTERRDHLEILRCAFEAFCSRIVVLRGGMNAQERRDADTLLHSGDSEARIILATGRYLGEGFDDPRLDTLFLTMPIAWKGTLAQYVGRLHRDYQDKHDVVVHDYVDVSVPVLARMAAKRQTGYRALGYTS